LSANFNVSATYLGPSVTVTGNVGGAASYRRATEERTSSATAHTHEVVTKASERILQRTLAQREQIESQETEQTTTHGLNNTSGDPIIGVYRWLERHFDLHLVNYGRRRIYEFVVPEPASYWSELLVRRADMAAGPNPAFPQMPPVVPPPPPLTPQTSDLSMAHFSLGSANFPLERPAQWSTLISLAAEWGVALEEPPPVAMEYRFVINAPESAGADPAGDATQMGPIAEEGPYVSRHVSTVVQAEKLTIPDGYQAVSGTASFKAWRPIAKLHGSEVEYIHESALSVLMINGQNYSFDSFWRKDERPENELACQPTWNQVIPVAKHLEGSVPVVLTTSFHEVSCSMVFECRRTDAHALNWARRMFTLFATAHAERVARHEDDKRQAQNSNLEWVMNLSSARARDVERQELKRGVLRQLIGPGLAKLGDTVLTDANDPKEPLPRIAGLHEDQLASYQKLLRFFEFGFDWTNIAYLFSPYLYGRRSKWADLALADSSDDQFKAFLGAGAARVQVPVRLGCEAHVEYFFRDLGIRAFADRLPWMDSMHAIAADLAEAARDGFEPGPGKLRLVPGSSLIQGIGTAFRDPEDTSREIRVHGITYLIEQVLGPAQATLSSPYAGTAASASNYELGGIVIGDAIPLTLPTTLVAIDAPRINLPAYPARYAGRA